MTKKERTRLLAGLLAAEAQAPNDPNPTVTYNAIRAALNRAGLYKLSDSLFDHTHLTRLRRTSTKAAAQPGDEPA